MSYKAILLTHDGKIKKFKKNLSISEMKKKINCHNFTLVPPCEFSKIENRIIGESDEVKESTFAFCDDECLMNENRYAPNKFFVNIFGNVLLISENPDGSVYNIGFK